MRKNKTYSFQNKKALAEILEHQIIKNIAEAGRKLGYPKPTVTDWVQRDGGVNGFIEKYLKNHNEPDLFFSSVDKQIPIENIVDTVHHSTNSIEIRMNFGKSIRQNRNKLGLTQEELAEKTDLSSNYIGSVERGERNISLENIIALAKAFQCSPGSLLDDSCCAKEPITQDYENRISNLEQQVEILTDFITGKK